MRTVGILQTTSAERFRGIPEVLGLGNLDGFLICFRSVKVFISLR